MKRDGLRNVTVRCLESALQRVETTAKPVYGGRLSTGEGIQGRVTLEASVRDYELWLAIELPNHFAMLANDLVEIEDLGNVARLAREREATAVARYSVV